MNNQKRPNVPTVRKGFHSVTPFLIADRALELIEFMKKAFGAEVGFMSKTEEDMVIHAYVKIGDSTIMIADTMEGMKAETALLYLYVDDADATFKKAVAAGGTVLAEIKDQFYGDRAGGIRDRWGNSWWIGTQIEVVPDEELDKRAKQATSINADS
jgi:PhnB protein